MKRPTSLADRLQERRAQARRLLEQRLSRDAAISTIRRIFAEEVERAGLPLCHRRSDWGIIKQLLATYQKERVLKLVRFAASHPSFFAERRDDVSWTSLYKHHQALWQALQAHERKAQRLAEIARQEQEEIERLNREARETIPAHILEQLPATFRNRLKPS